MSKKVFIRKSMADSDKFKEAFLLERLPDDIKDALKRNETSLGKNPAFPEEYGDSFDTRMALRHFNDAKNLLIKIGEVEDGDSIEDALSKLIKRCKELEAPLKDNLEKLAYTIIVGTFNIPNGFLTMDISLTDNISNSQISYRINPEEKEYDFESIAEKKAMNGEILKRRFINALITGGSLSMARDIGSYVQFIYQLDPQLPDLYRKIMALNDYLLFTREDVGITDNNSCQLGLSSVKIGNSTSKAMIQVEAEIFPVLIYEATKAVFELCVSHGLPQTKKAASYIRGKADLLKAEPWDMRLGYEIWNAFVDSMDSATKDMFPYVLMYVSKLPKRVFNAFFQEVLGHTKRGKRMMNEIISCCRKDMSDNGSLEMMTTPNFLRATLSDAIF